MTSWRQAAAWSAANVAATLVGGLVSCGRGDVAIAVLIGAFATAQTLSLITISRRFWLWLPVTLVATAIGFYASILGVFLVYQRIGHSDMSASLVAGLQDLGGGVVGWAAVAALQSFALWFGRRRWSWQWIPAVVVGGIGLIPLGAAAMLRFFSAVPMPIEAERMCDPLAIAGGPAMWIIGALWYSVATLVVLWPLTPRRDTVAAA